MRTTALLLTNTKTINRKRRTTPFKRIATILEDDVTLLSINSKMLYIIYLHLMIWQTRRPIIDVMLHTISLYGKRIHIPGSAANNLNTSSVSARTMTHRGKYAPLVMQWEQRKPIYDVRQGLWHPDFFTCPLVKNESYLDILAQVLQKFVWKINLIL